MADTIISLQNAQIYQGDKAIIKDVEIEITEGEFVYLIGKTGAGKSSLLKTLYGELYLKSGKGIVAGTDLSQLNWKTVPFLRRKMGIVFQDFKLLSDRTVHANLEFALKAIGWKDKNTINARIEEVLNKVGLPDKADKMPYNISGGEQQRVDIARALLNTPKLILADEPTGNLDPETTAKIMDLLIAISKESGTAVLMATHDYSILQNYPARILQIEEGVVKDVRMQTVA